MPLLLVLSFLFLILHPAVAFSGIGDGLELWFRIVLPTLFPFLILIGLMMSYQVPERISRLLSPLLQKTPFREEYLFPCMVGLLSGYPSGAKTLNDLVASRCLSRQEGEWLFCFCNNVSPAFFLNYVFVQSIPVGNLRFLLLFFLYLAAILASLPFRPNKRPEKKTKAFAGDDHSAQSGSLRSLHFQPAPKSSPGPKLMLDEIFMNTCEILVKTGCYIMVFSLLCQIAALYLEPYPYPNMVLAGCLEITNGISALSHLPSGHPFLLPASMAFCGFGGLSAMLQSFSVVKTSGLSKKKYALSKLLNTAYCILFALILNAL